MRSYLGAAVLQLSLIFQAYAWGPEGHSIVAEIAQRHLTAKAEAQVRQILKTNASLASISSWADDYRALHINTARWHFVDIPITAQDYDAARDCASLPQGDCVINEIARNLHDLKDASSSDAQRLDALRFLVHFVGDVNQPLHTVGELQGYNGMTVCYFSSPARNDCSPTNLHVVWDTGLIRSIFYDWGAYVEYLENDWLPRQDVSALSAGDPVAWALEAHAAARDVATKDVNINDHLAQMYLSAARPTLDRQLAAAGLRLARMLNDNLD